MKHTRQILILASLLLVLWTLGQGCGDGMGGAKRLDPSAPAPQPVILPSEGTSTGNPGQNKIDFNVVSKDVFSPNCVQCHSGDRAEGGVRYDSFTMTVTFGKLAKLRDSYRRHKEPSRDCPPISDQEMDMIADWITDGAVELGLASGARRGKDD